MLMVSSKEILCVLIYLILNLLFRNIAVILFYNNVILLALLEWPTILLFTFESLIFLFKKINCQE